MLSEPLPLEGRSNLEAAKVGLPGLPVIFCFLIWVLITQMSSVSKTSLSCTFLYYIYFNKIFLKCHYTEPRFLCPGKNRAIYLAFLLQISIYPKQEQEHIRSLQELSSNLIQPPELRLEGKAKASISEKDKKNNFQWLFSLKHICFRRETNFFCHVFFLPSLGK